MSLDIILEKFKEEVKERTKYNKAIFPEKVAYNSSIEILENIIEQQKLDNEIQRLDGLKESKEE